MSKLIVIRDFEDFQRFAGDCGPSKVEFKYGELAVDMLNNATAEELLIALRPHMEEEQAKTIVGILLESGISFDATLDGEVR